MCKYLKVYSLPPDYRPKKKRHRRKTPDDRQATQATPIVDSSSSGSEQSSDLEESGEGRDSDEGMTVEKRDMKRSGLVVTTGDGCEDGVVEGDMGEEEGEGDMGEEGEGDMGEEDGEEEKGDMGEEDGEKGEGDMGEEEYGRHKEVEDEEDVEGNIGEEVGETHIGEEEVEGNIGEDEAVEVNVEGERHLEVEEEEEEEDVGDNIGEEEVVEDVEVNIREEEEGTRGEEVVSNTHVGEEETERHMGEEEVEDVEAAIGEDEVEEEVEGDIDEEEEKTHMREVESIREEKERETTTDEGKKVEVGSTIGEEGERGRTEFERTGNNQEEEQEGILFVDSVQDVDDHHDEQKDVWGALTNNRHDEKLEDLKEGEEHEDDMVSKTELGRSGDHGDTTSTHLEEVPTHLREKVTETQAGTTAWSGPNTSEITQEPPTYLCGREVPESGLAQLDQNSKNPFDLLEDEGNVELSSGPQDTAGRRNPFDSPEPADPPTLTSVSPLLAQLWDNSDTLDTHTPPSPPPPQSHPHRNPFDSPPSPPVSPTSSDFFNEAVPTSLGQRSDEICLRTSRSDSMEWSVYMEETLGDSETLLSSLQLDENHYSPEVWRTLCISVGRPLQLGH